MFPGLPAASSLVPAAYTDWRFEREFYQRAYGATTVVHFTHKDCMDGAACDALVRRAYGDGAVKTVFLEPHETADALDMLVRVPSRARGLVISDLSFQKSEAPRVAEALAALSADGWRVMWRDHHHKQWEGVPRDALAASAHLVVDSTGTECGASLVQRDLLPDDAWARELARLARDHDLWLREDPQSMTLLHSVVHAGAARWVRHLLERRVVIDSTVEKWARREQTRHARLTRWGLRKARIVKSGRAVVGVAYGRVPTNEVLHGLEERGAHLSILVKPSGGFSLRSRKDIPICHRIAQAYGGGGHPNASGGRLGVGGLGLWTRRQSHPAVQRLVDVAVREVEAHLAHGE